MGFGGGTAVPVQTHSEDFDYPDWDRRTNAMPDLNRRVLNDSIEVLKTYFVRDPMAYVSGNTPVVFTIDGRRRRVVPDVFVVKNVPNRMRRGYRVTREGKPPDLVIELVSRSSMHEDSVDKFALYRDVLGVPEYFLFDLMRDARSRACEVIACVPATINRSGKRMAACQARCWRCTSRPRVRICTSSTQRKVTACGRRRKRWRRLRLRVEAERCRRLWVQEQ